MDIIWPDGNYKPEPVDGQLFFHHGVQWQYDAGTMNWFQANYLTNLEGIDLDWGDMRDYQNYIERCECGHDSVSGSNDASRHSTWCPKYRKPLK